MSERWKLYLVPWLGFILALAMHLWQIGQPPTIVGDEISFVHDGQEYVLGHTYFDPHPPLGKMQLGAVFTYLGYTPVTWRTVNAVEGALLVPLLWWLVWRLTRQRMAAGLMVVLTLLDGFLLVDSRLGLINVPYVLYALTALACTLKAIEARRPGWWLLGAGAMMGAAISVKWLAGTMIVPTIVWWCWPKVIGWKRHPQQPLWSWPLALVSFVFLPLAVYWLVFVIHFAWLGLPNTFWQLNSQMLDYQLRVPSSGDPYAAPWWGWLLMWQPALYWAQTVGAKIAAIWSMPNPWLWWTGSVAVGYSLIRGWRDPIIRGLNMFGLMAWLSFALIQRVMYSYHAWPFGIFSAMMVSVYLGRWWNRKPKVVWTYVVISLVVCIWFVPWWYGRPLSPTQQHLRRWLPGWYVRPASITPTSATPRPATRPT